MRTLRPLFLLVLALGLVLSACAPAVPATQPVVAAPAWNLINRAAA